MKERKKARKRKLRKNTWKVNLHIVITAVFNSTYDPLPPSITPPGINRSPNLNSQFPLFFVRRGRSDGGSVRMSDSKFIRPGQFKSWDPFLHNGEEQDDIEIQI